MDNVNLNSLEQHVEALLKKSSQQDTGANAMTFAQAAANAANAISTLAHARKHGWIPDQGNG